MSSDTDDRSTRFARWWVRRYTAGLAPDLAGPRQSEIDSDLAEHGRCRDQQGWPPERIGRERTARLIRGMPADLGWRHDLLRRGDRSLTRSTVVSVTSLASLLLAAFLGVFATYLLGATSLADRPLLGGMANYADKVDDPIESLVGAVVLFALAAVLVGASAARPFSPTMANAATIAIAIWAVLWFWLGVWPIGLVAVIGSGVDLAIRAPNPAESVPGSA